MRLFRVARRVLYGVVLGRAELYFRILGEESTVGVGIREEGIGDGM